MSSSAIVIEQSQEEAKLAFEVHQHAALGRIRLARAKIESRAPEGAKGPLAVRFRIRSKALENAPKDVLRLEIAFRMDARQEGEQAYAAVVDCAFETDYLLLQGFVPGPDHVRAFRKGNAVFNVWPYFREFLQNNLVRMGYPPLTAPFLRLQPRMGKKLQQKASQEPNRKPAKTPTERPGSRN
jgi:hypothetical protein